MTPSPRPAGGIAAVTCGKGTILHFVCIKSDNTIGHAIGQYDDHGSLTWQLGDLTGDAYEGSRIAIGCRDPHAPTPILDVVYQHTSGAVVSRSTRQDGSWAPLVYESDPMGEYVHKGTDLDVIYHHSFHRPLYLWQTYVGSVGPILKDGLPVKVPLGARFNFVVNKDTIHFYFLDKNEGGDIISHYVSGNTGKFYDPREPQMIPTGVSDFKMVEDSVSIVQSVDGADGIRASVRLLETWLNEDFNDWGTFSGPGTLVRPDIGLIVLSKGLTDPDACFSYVDAKTGDWLFLPIRQGQSVGYETPIPVAKGWFEGSNPQQAEPVEHNGNGNGNGHGNGYAVEDDCSDGVKEPIKHANGLADNLTRIGEGIFDAGTKDFPEWTRKFCKDVLMPRANETAIKTARKSGDPRLHAVLAPLSKLWDLGSDPITYKFLDGRFGGNEVQRTKVRTAIPEWTWYANVTFKEVAKGEPAYIKITFDPSDGSWSVIGNDATKEDDDVATMNLGWVKANNKNLPREERGVILHEFGHALGLLHEHQSPAHGSQSVLDPEATVKFYMKDQGWTREMVMDQVVKTYNLNDVSNFSQVDTKSIMHYYQPSEVTGGDPIDYNYVFSERDKAYMVINYPRSVADERKRTQGKDVTLEAALTSVGIFESAPHLAKKILAIRNAAATSGDIDIGQIRRIFTDWAKDKHAVKSEKLAGTRKKYMRGLLDKQYGLEDTSPFGLDLEEPDPQPCKWHETEEANEVTSTDSTRMRGVVNQDIFTRRPKFMRQDNDDSSTVFTWTIVQDPAGGYNRAPSGWDFDLVQSALVEWTSVLRVTFNSVAADQADKADLVIVFQDINPHTGKFFSADDDDSAHWSYCFDNRRTATGVKRTIDTLKKRHDEKWAPMADKKEEARLYEIATYPQVAHDICFRGVVTEKTVNQRATRKGKWAPAQRSDRTMAHEIGHFFGLDHEDNGFWCKLYENEKTRGKLVKAARKVEAKATVFDEASVMDSLRVDNKDREVWKKNGFKAVFRPSAKDRCNLSLFHAGPHLAMLGSDNKTYVLVTDRKSGLAIVDIVGNVLKLSDATIKEIKGFALKGQWSAVRATYMKAKREEIKQTAAIIKTCTDDELASMRAMKASTIQPRLRDANPDTTPGPAAAFAAPMPKLKEVLWSKLNELFGPSEHATSFLTVQSPARYLDKSEFSYKMEGIYSNFVKPVVVNEAEFRLTDQLYEPLRVVGAPNGQSLSINYEMILNNLVPRYVAADIEIRKAREKMRVWLLEETSSQNAFFVNDARVIGSKENNVVGKDESVKAIRKNNALAGPRVASRMEVCQRLMLEYLEASAAWKSKHSKMIQDAMHVHTDGRLQKLEDAAREIANTASVENSKLSAKYADVVVRGHLHTVRESLAQLDIKSTAEFLQDAKDSLRESALSSLYGASRVLPVIMNPMDWSESLDTSFDPQDLSSDPAIIEMNITAKARQIDTLRAQLGSLQHTVKEDEASLRSAMDNAADVYSKAQAELAGSYRESAKLLATRIVKACVPATGVADGITFNDGVSLDAQNSLKKMVTQLNPLGTINDLFAQMGAVDKAQQDVLAAGAKFSQRQTDWVRAKSATTAEQESAVSRQIEAAIKELESLQLQLTTAHLAKKKRSEMLAAKVGPTAEADNAAAMAGDNKDAPIVLPTMNDLAADATDGAPTTGSRWIQVVITSKEAADFQSKIQTTETTSAQSSISFFGFASSAKSAPKVSGSTEAVSQSSGLEVSISMNCTLVTVDRSSWFQPQFFSMADAFMRNNDNMSWTQGWDEEWKKDHSKAVDSAIINATKPVPPSFLPCFPTGYILAKDVLIKISRFKIRTVQDKKYLDEKTTSGGSFLFFSTAKTTQKTTDSSSSNFQMASDGMIVRIPGPQIIGYIQQMLPWDGTHKFNKSEALRPDIFLPGDEDQPNGSNANKPKGNVGRGLGPQPVKEESKEFTIRSTKSSTSQNTKSSSAGRSHAPAPKEHQGGNDDDDVPNGDGDDHEHDEGEMDHAMKLITAKLREKLNEPGFLEKLLSGST